MFRRKSGFQFGFLCYSSQFSGSSKASDHWEVVEEKPRATSDNLVDGMVIKGVAYILRFHLLVQVGTKVVFLDHVYMDVFG